MGRYDLRSPSSLSTSLEFANDGDNHHHHQPARPHRSKISRGTHVMHLPNHHPSLPCGIYSSVFDRQTRAKPNMHRVY
ncbi:hypothetical protein CC80DRAFT_247133 [Byssothecium circinans]|uniref:Uncharacterized protein n=1 Tax=Byssothecium circinans TaxID=147558 RepID=A0A6A5TBP6_9PLEO|nr:hypothetical protein CC80DRAFT_247133 [Byssothecium circinans]